MLKATIRMLLCLTILIMFTACQRNNEKIIVSVQDEGMTIRVDKSENGWKVLHYNHTFDVSGFSEAQRDSLKNSILDSLHLHGR